jgi:hypothetical protein
MLILCNNNKGRAAGIVTAFAKLAMVGDDYRLGRSFRGVSKGDGQWYGIGIASAWQGLGNA